MTRPGRLRWRYLAFPGDNHASSSARRPAWALPVCIRFGLCRSELDLCPRQHRLHLMLVTCTSYQPVLSTCSPLFGRANPIWKTITVLLPSSPLESGAGMRNSYEFLCIRSTTWDCCGEITRQKTASLLPRWLMAAGEVLAGTALGPCPQQVSAATGAAGSPCKPLAGQLCAFTWRQAPFASLLPRKMACGPAGALQGSSCGTCSRSRLPTK